MGRAGADLVITSRDVGRLADFEQEITQMGRRVLLLDVRNPHSIDRMADRAYDHFGKIDILVNNAGCNVRKPALDVTWEDWNTVLDTNLRGTFFTAQAAARYMVEAGYGDCESIPTSVDGNDGLEGLACDISVESDVLMMS